MQLFLNLDATTNVVAKPDGPTEVPAAKNARRGGSRRKCWEFKAVGKEFWIEGFECGPVGPYSSLTEAEKTAVRLDRFYRIEYPRAMKE